jgi:nucleoporin GLE1
MHPQTQQIVDIINPYFANEKPVYFALLASLAKAILLQAETEVTAEKRSALPLAQVTANLLGALNKFPDILWAKLVGRAGGWPVPCVVPDKDFDDAPYADEKAAVKARGYRSKEETLAEHTTRVSGMMRVYFHVLCAPVPNPLDPRFRSHRYWTWFARILSEPKLLESPVAAEVIYGTSFEAASQLVSDVDTYVAVALDVNGLDAKAAWGAQWVKLLEVLYEGVTVGIFNTPDRLIGGTSAEGTAARVRVQLEIERIMNS